MQPNFNASRTDYDLIAACADRAASMLHLDRMQTMMDLTVAGNAVPLDFGRLLVFPMFDFAHDVLGIARHLNRETGEIDGLFLPRCAR